VDTLLRGGTHGVDGRGIPVAIGGVREVLQQAMIRLTVQKGRFRLDPGLGSELYKLAGHGEATRNRMAAAYVQEALSDLRGVQVEDVTCRFRTPDVLVVVVGLSVDSGRYGLEVVV